MDFSKLSLIEIKDKIANKEVTSEEVVKFFLAKCEEKKDLNAFVEIFDDAVENAKIVDKKIANGEPVGLLAGVPIAITDTILYKGKKMSCASKFMQNFVAPYSSTVVEKRLAAFVSAFMRNSLLIDLFLFRYGGSEINNIA